MKRTRSQQYAAKAFEQVSNLPQDIDKEKYGGMAKKLPFLVQTAGLVHALEFVATRKEKDYRLLVDHLAQNLGEKDGNSLRQTARKAEISEYMRLTRNVMAALQWYKRFAQSVLDIDD